MGLRTDGITDGRIRNYNRFKLILNVYVYRIIIVKLIPYQPLVYTKLLFSC